VKDEAAFERLLEREAPSSGPTARRAFSYVPDRRRLESAAALPLLVAANRDEFHGRPALPPLFGATGRRSSPGATCRRWHMDGC